MLLMHGNTIQVINEQKFDANTWYMAMSNHQSWADIFVLLVTANHRIPLLKFFMKKELLMLLNAINNKSKVTVRILTNVSVYDTDIIEKLKEFQKVNLMLSIDAVGRHIEISRWKSNWKVLETNIQRFKKDRYATLRNAKIRLSNIKLDEFVQVMRGKSKWIKH